MGEAKVLVIIVTYNKNEYVGNLLTSLQRIDYKNYDAVVVDNASTDGTVEHLTAHFPGVKLIRNNENTGGSGGFNTGLNYAFGMDDYPYYWLLDNDVEVSKEALTELVRVLDEHPDIAVAGSQMCQLDNPEVTNEIGAYVDLHNGGLILNRHLTRRRNNSTGIFYVDYVAAASMLVRADIAKKAGLWEDFFIHFDDVRKRSQPASCVSDPVREGGLSWEDSFVVSCATGSDARLMPEKQSHRATSPSEANLREIGSLVKQEGTGR